MRFPKFRIPTFHKVIADHSKWGLRDCLKIMWTVSVNELLETKEKPRRERIKELAHCFINDIAPLYYRNTKRRFEKKMADFRTDRRLFSMHLEEFIKVFPQIIKNKEHSFKEKMEDIVYWSRPVRRISKNMIKDFFITPKFNH